jgi:putative ABC transport system permease protein
MLRNFIKIAWRTLWKNRRFSAINILGLGLGMACSLLIFLWVQDERNVDSYPANRARIFDVYERVYSEGSVDVSYQGPGLLARELKRTQQEVEYSSGFVGNESGTFQVGEKIMTLTGAAADSDFFRIFNYRILEGTPGSALNGPKKIAISRKMAKNFFGSPAGAIHQAIRFDNDRAFDVSAVFDDLPSSSSDQFDYLLNWDFQLDTVGWLRNWIFRGARTFVLLRPGVNTPAFEHRISHFLEGYLTPGDGQGFRLELGLQRFDQKYLHGRFRNGRSEGGRIEYVRLFSLVSMFVLLIACINFMNLATARSAHRAKEVGIRKTVGADRLSLIGQFMGEALWLTLLAGILAWGLVQAVLPAFNALTGKQLNLVLPWQSLAELLALLVLLTGLLSGSYPAIFLSSLKPVSVLKGTLKISPGSFWFRKGLVIFQLGLSILLIIGTLVIGRQVSYVQGMNLGFNRENLIYLPLQGDLWRHYSAFKQELAGMPGIQELTRTDQPPSETGAHAYDMQWEGKNPAVRTVVIHVTVGYEFLHLMNIKLLQGRDFSRDFPSDSSAYIVNETALRLIGYKDPIGKPLELFQNHGKIIGVVKDFHFKSLHDPIEPLVINLSEWIRWGFVLVKTQPGKTREAVASLQAVHQRMNPRFPLVYHFADEEYQSLYNNEQMVSKLSGIFAFLAIFISALGLLGLAILMSEQRSKEIGIRKILGATAASIFALLSREFLLLAAVAFLIASPLSWMVMRQWLQDYAYRTPINWWIFPLAGFSAALIALVTVSFQALKASRVNPVTSLRSQ